MGWTGYKKGKKEIIWGDCPQDEVDGKTPHFKKLETMSQKEIEKIYKKLIKNKSLKKKIDRCFQEDWDRKAKQIEVKKHVCVGLMNRPRACKSFNKYKIQTN